MIKVSLGRSCYRYIQIGKQKTLGALSEAILSAFEFDDDHCHAFFMDDRYWSDLGAYYSDDMDEGCRISYKMPLGRLGLEKGDKFKYLFDFGDEYPASAQKGGRTLAVTGFWPVKGQLKAVLDYADNPDKTTPQRYLDSDLYDTLKYAANDAKTDRTMFVGGINCSKQNAYGEMVAVQKRFGNRGSVVAYHGIQSFRAGEVTPEMAFAIGRETARRMWGGRYQVLVTVHLNTENIHCHFVVNPVSFKDGSKFQNKIGDHKELRKISDAICREHGLSVLENSDFYKHEKKGYWLHQQGKKTHRDMLREDVEYCLTYVKNWEQFEKQMVSRGYSIDKTRLSVKAQNWQRPVRLSSLGYTKEVLRSRFDENFYSNDFRQKWNTHLPYKPKKFPLEWEMERLAFTIEHSHNTEEVFVDTVLLLLILVIELVLQTTDVMLLSPDLRAVAKDLESYRADYRFLQENGIHTMAQLEAVIPDIQSQIDALEAERSKTDNPRRRAKTPEKRQEAKDHKKELTQEIAPLRKKLRQAKKILDESPHLYELLQEEHRLEQAAYQKFRERMK